MFPLAGSIASFFAAFGLLLAPPILFLKQTMKETIMRAIQFEALEIIRFLKPWRFLRP